MNRAKDPPLRPRLTIPVADALVAEWISCQADLSTSFRAAVRELVAQYGMVDITCRQVESPARPTRAVVPAAPALPPISQQTAPEPFPDPVHDESGDLVFVERAAPAPGSEITGLHELILSAAQADTDDHHDDHHTQES